MAIRVVTYNLLADKYAGNHSSYCPDEHLRWSHRLPLIALELDDYDMDILMLQEVEATSYEDDFRPMMRARGYEGIFLPRLLPDVPGPPEGVALFYLTSLLSLVKAETVIFSESPPFPLPSRSTGSPQLNECLNQFRRRPEGGILALLEHKSSGKTLLAASVHLFWNPAYPDVKVLQALSLCSAIIRFSLERLGTIDVPLVIGGDFNSIASKRLPDPFDKVLPSGGLVSGVYHLMTQGTLDSSHPDHPVTRRSEKVDPPVNPLSPPPPLTSTYSSGLGQLHSVQAIDGVEPPLTTKTSSFAGTLDYIFASRHWRVVSRLDLPYTSPLQWKDPLRDVAFGPIPSESFPSDHMAVGGEIELL